MGKLSFKKILGVILLLNFIPAGTTLLIYLFTLAGMPNYMNSSLGTLYYTVIILELAIILFVCILIGIVKFINFLFQD